MGTLSFEPAPQAERLSARPRIYVDANVPAGTVGVAEACVILVLLGSEWLGKRLASPPSWIRGPAPIVEQPVGGL